MFQEYFEGFHGANVGGVNVFHLETGNGAILVDCADATSAPKLIDALCPMPSISNIVVTHAHYDHAGGAAAVSEATKAPVWMHEADADIASRGQWKRPSRHAGTPLSWVLNKLVVERGPASIPPVEVTHRIQQDGSPDGLGGLSVHHLPGHSAGQIALTWTSQSGKRILFAADVCMNLVGLTQPIIYEDRNLGLTSIRKLAEIAEGVDLAVFGHGKPLRNPASKLKKFAARLPS